MLRLVLAGQTTSHCPGWLLWLGLVVMMTLEVLRTLISSFELAALTDLAGQADSSQSGWFFMVTPVWLYGIRGFGHLRARCSLSDLLD